MAPLSLPLARAEPDGVGDVFPGWFVTSPRTLRRRAAGRKGDELWLPDLALFPAWTMTSEMSPR